MALLQGLLITKLNPFYLYSFTADVRTIIKNMRRKEKQLQATNFTKTIYNLTI